jgi:hypothetical protein
MQALQLLQRQTGHGGSGGWQIGLMMKQFGSCNKHARASGCACAYAALTVLHA